MQMKNTTEPLDKQLKAKISQRYNISYIENIDVRTTIQIFCSTEKDARALEQELKRDNVAFTPGLSARTVEIPSRTRDFFIDIVLTKKV